MILAMLPSVAPAEETEFESFVAFGASAETGEVVAVRFAEKQGELTLAVQQREPLGVQAAPMQFHAGRRRLYVASLRAEKEESNKIISLAVGKDGKLSDKQEFPLPHGSAYLSLDQRGEFLLSASYFSGHVDVFPVLKDGALGESTCNVFEDRDKAHSIRTTNDNRFAYVPYVKDHNAMFQYAFDSNTGELKPLSPAQAEVGENAGPRHVAHHPTKPFVYFSNEQHLGVSVYRIGEKGALKLTQVCDASEFKAEEGIAASDIEITADGRFVFVAVRDFARGEVDSIHSYAVQGNGAVSHVGKVAADSIPWGLQVSPEGKYVLVTAARGNTLTAFRIEKNGTLKRTAAVEWGKMIRDIAVVPVP